MLYGYEIMLESVPFVWIFRLIVCLLFHFYFMCAAQKELAQLN